MELRAWLAVSSTSPQRLPRVLCMHCCSEGRAFNPRCRLLPDMFICVGSSMTSALPEMLFVMFMTWCNKFVVFKTALVWSGLKVSSEECMQVKAKRT